MSGGKNEHAGVVPILAAGVLWGTIGLFVKQLDACGSTPELTSLLRVFFAFVIMTVISVSCLGWRALLMGRKTLFTCVLLGFVCHGIYNIFYSFAVTLAGVAVSAVLLNVAPIVTMLCAVFLYGEGINAQKIIAIILDVIGCVITATNGSLSLQDMSIAGILCGIAAGVCYAMTAILGRFAADQSDPMVMSTYSYLFATIFLTVWMRPWTATFSLNGGIIFWSLLFALIPTAIAYLLYYRGLQNLRETSKVPVIASVETVVAAMIGALLYQERLSAIGLTGVLLVLVSIVVMNARIDAKKKTESRSDDLQKVIRA